MRAYEFTTNIKQGTISIPMDDLKNLNTQNNVRVIILAEDEQKIDLNSAQKNKLSEYLLVPEIEDNENLFNRNNDTGREINL